MVLAPLNCSQLSQFIGIDVPISTAQERLAQIGSCLLPLHLSIEMQLLETLPKKKSVNSNLCLQEFNSAYNSYFSGLLGYAGLELRKGDRKQL